MSSYRPFIVKLYWGGKVSNIGGVISIDENTLTSSFIVRTDSMSYNELLDIVCSHVQIDRATVNVNLVLYYTFQGVPLTSNLFGDEGVNITAAEEQPDADEELEDADEEIQQEEDETEDSEVPPSDSESDDEFILPHSSEQYHTGVYQGFCNGPTEDYDEVAELRDCQLPDFDDEDYMDIWNPNANQIRVGMFFKTKEEVVCAVRQWNVACNREIIVSESRPSVWRPNATQEVKNTVTTSKHPFMSLGCNGAQQQPLFKIKDVAAHISRLIQSDISLPVKQIRAYLKDTLHVDVSYSKAWLGRRKAIENIHGSWDTNFMELPSYMRELQNRNNGTVVQWFHHPHGTSHCATFKYVFWAFKPSIDAFHLCQPVISIDGTHLKGPYRSKLLIAVSKNANNYILPVAYAIVDEETIESWSWFLKQFRDHVADDRMGPLCVLSDRHKGIIHAMTNMDDWKEPNAYHRFCLRHVRSNLMNRFKSASIKKLCWAIGSTTQKRKYISAVRELRSINEEAWQYLLNIEKQQWTLLFDSGRRRWGTLTTNISESMNNVLRDARLLPIKACIDFTFQKDVSQYVKHAEIANNCNTALPPRMWRVFNNRDRRAQDHEVFLYDHLEARYRVTSKMETNDDGGNDYTVEYFRKKCTCRKWQTERFPCSHAIAVCRHRDGLPHEIVDVRFHTSTYRQQYGGHYYPLRHKSLWSDAGWRIQGDPSKVTTLRGRRRARRIRNEMDVHYADEPRNYKCGICKELGHRRTNCPYVNH
ncbi:hypothetical protein E3N88_11558 [Mikania micrantha]|uniref:SWIM-type domain-containing protein n=1 Tax=Mikania micrantha TaxID=192012 RepID=A0A5N6PFZ0_9ASTR|nr:hypothetical protein E3N88_11558 [Mikania micrantha]